MYSGIVRTALTNGLPLELSITVIARGQSRTRGGRSGLQTAKNTSHEFRR